ncbi:MAG: hypothetical protein K5681_01390 [Treponema sp.]|nr:hypothetical protein [Treponema sp.]
MGISVKEIVTGRKTFFITPDTSLIPESYLEDYFALGYECYFVENDKRIKIEKKVDVILSLFRDVILFFNIDYSIPDLDWNTYIKSVVDSLGNRASIGILYTKRQSKEEKSRLEHRFLYDMGVQCGCIQLEYQKKQNFELIEKILYANQAQGRRKNIRALCTNACTFTCNHSGMTFTGILQDISLSHFSIISPDKRFTVQLYEKISDFHFNIRGFMFRSDAVLIMERPLEYQSLMVFAFVTSTGANGLDQRINQLLIPNIYKLMSATCSNLLNQLYTRIEDHGVGELEEFDDNI